MNKLSTEDAEDLERKLYDAIQTAPRRMKEHEIGEAVTMAYKRAFGIGSEVRIEKGPSYDGYEVLSTGKDVHVALVNLMISEGWNKSCCVDVLQAYQENDDKDWNVEFEVFHETREKHAAGGKHVPGGVVVTWWK